MNVLRKFILGWVAPCAVLLAGFVFAEDALGGFIKEVNESKDRAVLRFKRKIVRDLYEADVVTIRMVSSNAVINVAIIQKKAMQAIVGILPDQDLDGLEIDAEFVFVEDNRVPTYNVWGRESGDIQLADSSLLGGGMLLGYRTLQFGSSSYSSEIGYGFAIKGLYRSFGYGGLGCDFDIFTSDIDFVEAKQKGEFSQRRIKPNFNLTVSDRISFGGDLMLQVASRDILNSDETSTVNTDYVATHYGVAVNYRGYNWNLGFRYRNRGALRIRTKKEGEEGRDVSSFDLSTQFGVDYWFNKGRESATYLKLTYFKFENLSGAAKPDTLESINFLYGYENFLNAQRSLFVELEKFAPYTPDQFGILRLTSTYNLGLGLNSTFAKDYDFAAGFNVGYGTDKPEGGENITELALGIFARVTYKLR